MTRPWLKSLSSTIYQPRHAMLKCQPRLSIAPYYHSQAFQAALEFNNIREDTAAQQFQPPMIHARFTTIYHPNSLSGSNHQQ